MSGSAILDGHGLGSPQDIGETLQVMLGEAETNRFSIEGRSYEVIPQADRGFRLTKEWLERYYPRTRSGSLVPLSTVIALKQTVQPNTAPSGYRPGYQGESRRFMQESQGFLVLFATSLVFIYLVLSAQFNSFRDPLIVLVSVPLSIFGALVPLARCSRCPPCTCWSAAAPQRPIGMAACGTRQSFTSRLRSGRTR